MSNKITTRPCVCLRFDVGKATPQHLSITSAPRRVDPARQLFPAHPSFKSQPHQCSLWSQSISTVTNLHYPRNAPTNFSPAKCTNVLFQWLLRVSSKCVSLHSHHPYKSLWAVVTLRAAGLPETLSNPTGVSVLKNSALPAQGLLVVAATTGDACRSCIRPLRDVLGLQDNSVGLFRGI